MGEPARHCIITVSVSAHPVGSCSAAVRTEVEEQNYEDLTPRVDRINIYCDVLIEPIKLYVSKHVLWKSAISAQVHHCLNDLNCGRN